MFRPGDKKPETSGRKPGTPNKRTTMLVDTLDSLEIEPIRKIVDLLPMLEPKEQVGVYLDLLAYVFPKRKAVEFTEETVDRINQYSQMDVRELIKIARGYKYESEK